VNRAIFLKSILIQLAAVAVVAVVLAALLPKSFFESWGWLSGPVAWLLCAAFTASVLRLDVARTVLGAALAGIPSIVFVIVGIHWLGAVFAAVLFGFWCAGSFGGSTAKA
jgi:hypothetical protein